MHGASPIARPGAGGASIPVNLSTPALPKALGLSELLAAFGISVPMNEPPRVCPLIVDAAEGEGEHALNSCRGRAPTSVASMVGLPYASDSSMSDRVDLADPDFEPTDEQLMELSRRAFSGVKAARAESRAKLRAEIAAARVAANDDLASWHTRPRTGE